MKAGADPTIAYNGRTALDFAEAISPEFHASLQGTSLLLVSCILESNHIFIVDVIQDQQTSKMKEESLLLPVKGFGNAGTLPLFLFPFLSSCPFPSLAPFFLPFSLLFLSQLLPYYLLLHIFPFSLLFFI